MRFHSYLRFRLRLGAVGLKNFIASFKTSAFVAALALGPVLLGLLVALALPALYAPVLARPLILPVIGLHGAVMALPVWLLRQRLLPAAIQDWQRALPVPGGLRLLADVSVAAIVMLPLALCYAISAGFALFESPPWLRPIWPLSLLALFISLILSWAIATAILASRARPARAQRQRVSAPPTRYQPGRAMPRALHLWHRLFWLPFWRNSRGVGVQQSALLLLCLASVLMWMWPAPAPQHGLMALCSSVLLVMLTDRGDKAIHEQLQKIAPAMAAWPIAPMRLALYARVASLVPALFILFLWAWLACARHAALSKRAALLYLGVATLSQLAIVGLRKISAEGRVILLVLSMLMLIAIGSEIWN